MSYAQKAQKMRIVRKAFIVSGESFKALARAYDLTPAQVKYAVRITPAATGHGPAPEECRFGLFKGYRETIEPLLSHYGITWAQVMGPSRIKRVNNCRWHCYVELEAKGKKYLHIGQFFGRNHTTVLHAVKKWRRGGKPYSGRNVFYWGA